MPSLHPIQASLLSNCQSLADHSDVHDCLQDLLIDVELAVTLEERLESAHAISNLQYTVDAQTVALAEAHTLRQHTLAQQSQLADGLLDDLLVLSDEIGRLKDTKEQHETLLVQYDATMAKLLVTEERLQAERARRVQVQKERDKAVAAVKQPSQQKQQQQVEVDTDRAAVVKTTPVQSIDETKEETSKEQEEVMEHGASTGGATTTTTTTASTVEQPSGADTASYESQKLSESADSGVASTTEGLSSDEPMLPTDDTLHTNTAGPDKESMATNPEVTVSSEKEANAPVVSQPATEGGASDTALEEEAKDAPAATLVALDDENIQDPAPLHFNDLETEVLMKVFAFLDALDILNVAQISLPMYNRVDMLFGLGDDSGSPGDNSTIATTETTAITPAAAAAASLQQPTVVALPPAKDKPVSDASTTVSQPAAAQPTMVAIPQKKPTPTPEPQQKPRSMTPPRVAANLFSLLQPRRPQQQPPAATPQQPATTTTTSTASAAAPPTPRSSPPSSSSALPMNAAMANSMAAKLSDAELNAIIIMTERLKQKETLAAQLLADTELLTAQRDGTEQVKSFLVQKVRDMEITISASVENELKVAQQIVSDQEVIAFLDARVQELERLSRDWHDAQQASDHTVATVQQQASEKASVMGDMLQFEREKLKESEREWKATKKVLVKEVKSCRAQIQALQRERDQYKEELMEQQQQQQQHRQLDHDDHDGVTNHHHNGNHHHSSNYIA